MKKYVLVEWPDCQMFMNRPRWDECFLIDGANAPDSSYMVPEDLYEEVFNGDCVTLDDVR